MRKIIKRCQQGLLMISILLMNLPVFADLPKPPDSDIANGSNDWLDVGGTLMGKAIKISCIGLGAIILVGAAGGIIKAYHVAHDKQDLGHFFKMLIVGLVAAAVGLGLVYAGYTIVNSQS